MNAWTLTAIALVPPFAACIAAAARGAPAVRLIACQLAAALLTLLLSVMTYAFDQPALIDLALCSALLSLPSAVLFATVLERWL